jgi:hypothetical protein
MLFGFGNWRIAVHNVDKTMFHARYHVVCLGFAGIPLYLKVQMAPHNIIFPLDSCKCCMSVLPLTWEVPRST